MDPDLLGADPDLDRLTAVHEGGWYSDSRFIRQLDERVAVGSPVGDPC